MSQKLTKMEAAARLDVSQSTIDRMIQKGEPPDRKRTPWEPLQDMGADGRAKMRVRQLICQTIRLKVHTMRQVMKGLMVADMSEVIELAVLRERVRNLEELADYHREQLKDSEWRYQQAMEQLGASQRIVDVITKAIPAADPGSPIQRRHWWPFGKGRN